MKDILGRIKELEAEQDFEYNEMGFINSEKDEAIKQLYKELKSKQLLF